MTPTDPKTESQEVVQNTPVQKKLSGVLGRFTESPRFRVVFFVVGGLFVASLIFHAGMVAGYHKANFSYAWGDRYAHEFGDHDGRPGMMKEMRGPDFFPAHGTAGKITAVSLPTLVIVGKDNAEKIVRLNDATELRGYQGARTRNDIATGTFIVALGDPNANGEIEAKLIRILPLPPEDRASGDQE